MIEVLLADKPLPLLERELPASQELSSLAKLIRMGSMRERKKAMTIIACLKGIPATIVAASLNVRCRTVRRDFNRFNTAGHAALLSRRKPRCSDLEGDKQLLFALLHSPPSAHGINRTSWKMDDLHRVLATTSHRMSHERIRKLIKAAGFRWRRAKVVLTSNDPDYRSKVTAIKKVLSELREDEAFFSIDEFGPFAVKRIGGLRRVSPDENYQIPQWQKSKGWMIITAALDLEKNQVIHFYSLKKNTDEMIKMADLLRIQYRGFRTIYLSWDAASWHVSKKLFAHLEEMNQRATGEGFAVLKTAPLPAGSQFLNVIESVFSGMARAIIHNSDYSSVEDAKCAIDRYFKERNDHFSRFPKRAGHKIWGLERVPSEFSESHNCKDPRY
jgi:transposase